MSLQREIEQLLAGFSVSADIAAAIAESHVQLEQSGVAPGLPVGAEAPDFELTDSMGRVVRLSERLLRGPVVLSFFRGAWCPICNLQLAAFQRVLPQILDLGAEVLAVHPDASPLVEAPPQGFSILEDSEQEVIRGYRLQFTLSEELRRIYPIAFGISVAEHNKDGSWNLPVPGTYVIGADGRIKRRHVKADFTLRMEPDEVVGALQEL